MKKDDIAENVLKHGKEGVKQNIIEALDEFCDDFAEEMWEAAEEIITLRKENAALRERLEKAVELPYSHLEMLKLLTCASICYAEIKNLIVARMAKSRDVADLFMECPTVQGTILDLALYRLSESNLNCNKIKGFEEVINATGSFKDYLAKAEARLKELQGGEE